MEGLKKLTRKEVIQLVKIKKTIKGGNGVFDRARFNELQKEVDNKTKTNKSLQECKKILKKAISFEARKLHKNLKSHEKDDAKAIGIKQRYDIVKVFERKYSLLRGRD
jgi:hypothetical protein